MDKGRRNELIKLKYKKRLNQLGLKDGEGKFYAYKSHGKPCSCSMCSYLNLTVLKPKKMFPSLKPCGCVVAHCNCPIMGGFFQGSRPMRKIESRVAYLTFEKSVKKKPTLPGRK